MNAPSVRRQFSAAMTTLEKYYYYACGLAADPQSFTFEIPDNANPIQRKGKDSWNLIKETIHSHYIDDAIDKALTGDHAPKPGGTDILKAIAPIFSKYASQFLKSPVGLGSAIVLCGATLMMNPQIREDIGKAIDETVEITSQATNKIGEEIVNSISPTIPIELTTKPVFKPVKR